MPLETATFISDLDPNNPAHTDQLNQDDGHMRLVKSSLKATFPSITGAVTVTQAQINTVAGATYPFTASSFAANSVVTAAVTDKNITYPKIQDVAASRLLGNPTGSPVSASEISVGGGLVFNGPALQIGAGALGVGLGQVQPVAASTLLANPTGAAASPSPITLGTGLKFYGTSLMSTVPVGIGYVSGLLIKNHPSLPYQLMYIQWDEVFLTDGSGNGYRAGTGTVNVNFAGTGAGGVDVSSRGASTGYDLYLISDGATVAGIATANPAGPTMPTGYTFKKRIGWVRTDAASNLMGHLQIGNKAQYVVWAGMTGLPVMLTTTASASQNVEVAGIWVPAKAASIRCAIQTTNGVGTSFIGPSVNYTANTNGIIGNAVPAPVVLTYGTAYSFYTGTGEMLLEATSVYCHTDGGASFLVAGWTDNI